MKRVLTLILICPILAACSPDSLPPINIQVTKVEEITPQPINLPVDSFEVKAWVDKPTPSQDDQVIVRGSLIKNGVHLGGMMMYATWPDANHERGVPNCSALVTYGSGVCTIEAIDFPSGQFVPIMVLFEYRGKRYIGHTGFTPR